MICPLQEGFLSLVTIFSKICSKKTPLGTLDGRTTDIWGSMKFGRVVKKQVHITRSTTGHMIDHKYFLTSALYAIRRDSVNTYRTKKSADGLLVLRGFESVQFMVELLGVWNVIKICIQHNNLNSVTFLCCCFFYLLHVNLTGNICMQASISLYQNQLGKSWHIKDCSVNTVSILNAYTCRVLLYFSMLIEPLLYRRKVGPSLQGLW